MMMDGSILSNASLMAFIVTESWIPIRIEAESIEMIFRSPILDAVDDVFAHHMSFRGCIISDPGAIRKRTVRGVAVK